MALPAVATGVQAAYKAIPESAKRSAMKWVKQATGGAVSNITQAVKYATGSPVQAAVVAEGMVRSGAPSSMVVDWFGTDVNSQQIRESLIRLGQTLNATVESQRPGVNGSVSDTSADSLRLQLVKTLVRAFGSTENARRVQLALGSLKNADFDWYDSISKQFGR